MPDDVLLAQDVVVGYLGASVVVGYLGEYARAATATFKWQEDEVTDTWPRQQPQAPPWPPPAVTSKWQEDEVI